jgi:hypothetical protein
MSLVSDALRKARQYATARDIQRHGAAAGALVPPPRRSRLGVGLVLGAAIALAAAAAGAVFVLWALRNNAAGRDAATVAAPGEAAPTPPTTPPAIAGGALVRNEPAARPAEVAEAPAGTMLAADAPQPERQTAGSPVPVESLTPAASGTAGGPGERVYILHADLGYATLHLDFLVYKTSGGFGRINGLDVAPGTIVEGFVVEEIGSDFIRLRDSRGPLVLRTR